jgi:ankyrin repeat protein
VADAIAVHEAYKRGDLAALKAALGHPPGFPNVLNPPGLEAGCLEYAIYHGPLVLIRALLELGAEPNNPDSAGFPCLIAALSAGRLDRHAIVELLLAHGAEIGRRGVNDYTPLHYAAATDDVQAIELLLTHGVDPGARTRIDDCASPWKRRGCWVAKPRLRRSRGLSRRCQITDAGLSPAPGYDLYQAH